MRHLSRSWVCGGLRFLKGDSSASGLRFLKGDPRRDAMGLRSCSGGTPPPQTPCAQHGHDPGGESPHVSRPSQAKRTATAEGRPTVGRKRGAKSRADEQKPDERRRRAGRAGGYPRSHDGQGPGDVDPAAMRRRVVVLTWGDLASCLKGRRTGNRPERGVSIGHRSCALAAAKGRT